MTKEERQYHLNRAKDNTPSSSWFIYIVAAGVVFTVLCRNNLPWRECANLFCI